MATVAAMTGCGPVQSSVSPVMVESNCYSGAVRPMQIVLACGDGNAVAKDLSWSTWGSYFADGHGAVSQNTCVPGCASGHFVDHAASFRLSEPVAAGSHRFFTRITIAYDAATLTGQRVDVLKDCFDNPPNPGVPRCPADLQGA